MTSLETVNRLLDELKRCPATENHACFSRVLLPFRFLPTAQRHECALAFRQWAGEHAEREPLKAALAEFLLGLHHFRDEEHEAALTLLTGARRQFEELSDREGIGLCAMLIGAIYRTLGNFELALKVLWEGDGLLRESGRYPAFVAANANSLAYINLELHHYDEALPLFHLAYDESTKANDFYFNIYALHGLGKVFAHQGKRAEAEEVFDKALRLAEQNDHPAHIANSLTELANLHADAGDVERAEALNARALAIREQHHLTLGAATSSLNLGKIHLSRGKWDEALAALNRGLAIAEQSGVKPKMCQAHLLLSEMYEKRHDLEQSLRHFKRYHELREQVEREDSARKLADAKLIFQAEQTRKENVVIKEQKEEIQRQNRQLQDTIDELTRARIGRKARAWTFAVAVVLFIFQDAILRTALQILNSDNYFLSLAVKMAIIFSLSPINKGIERHLLKGVMKKERARWAAEAQAA